MSLRNLLTSVFDAYDTSERTFDARWNERSCKRRHVWMSCARRVNSSVRRSSVGSLAALSTPLREDREDGCWSQRQGGVSRWSL